MRIEEILNYEIEDILKSAELSNALLKCYSNVYMNGLSVRGCQDSKRKYYRRLFIDEKMGKLNKYSSVENRTAKFEKEFSRSYNRILMKHISSSNVTDEQAIEYLAKKAIPESFFETLPFGYESAIKALSKNAKVEDIIKKATELNREFHNPTKQVEEVEEVEDDKPKSKKK